MSSTLHIVGFTSSITYGIIFVTNTNGTRETCPFRKVSREEAPAAASAPTRKKWIPLASLYR